MGFQLNTAIVTGASNGIGEELAYQLASEGAWLTLAARNEEKLEAVARRCEILGSHMRGRVLVVPTDVSDEAQCKQLIEATVQEYGRLDTLINNAGLMTTGQFEELETLDPFHKLMAVNYFGAVYCTRYALPHIKKTDGRIAAVASLHSRIGKAGYTGYAATKGAVAAFFNTLGAELQETKVSVTVLHPAEVNTGIHQRAFGPTGELLGEDGKASDGGVDVETIAKQMLKAIDQRKQREAFTIRGRAALISNAISPSLLDYVSQTINRELVEGPEESAESADSAPPTSAGVATENS